MDYFNEFLERKYRLTTSENFDEYLKYLGVGYISRKTATSTSPTLVLTRNDDDTYTMTLSTIFRRMRFSFKFGEEYIETRPDGVRVRSVMLIEGHNMVQIQTEDSGRQSKHVRTFTKDAVTAVTTADGWDGQCVRIYEYIP